MVSVAVVPAAAQEAEQAQVRRTRLAIAFHTFPDSLVEGGHYDGEPVVRSIPELGIIAITTFDPSGFTQRQLADPNVKYVNNDDPVPLLLERSYFPPGGPGALLTPNDPQYGSMYGPQQTRVNLAWDNTTGDIDAAVCVIDTGTRNSHEDLGTARYLGGYDYVNNDNNPADDQGHGTHVAGTAVGGVNNGVGVSGMGNTGYYSVKVLDSAGSGSFTDVAAGINWCANNAAARTVLSMSLGCSCSDATISSAIHYAFATKGMLVAAASGNGYCNNCVGFPGNHPEAIGVACTDSSEASCSFTSKGPEVDIAAPGSGIISTCYGSDTQYCTKSGTSMSTPHASGILALFWSDNPTMTAIEVWQRLNDTAEDLGAEGKDSTFGWGRIDAWCLFTNELCSIPPPPPPPPPPTEDIFEELFESGTSEWTLGGLWHASTCRSSSATTSLAYNKDGACPPTYNTGGTNAGEAISPEITIPAAATYVRLRLASWAQTEGGSTYDQRTIHVSANGSAYTQIHQDVSSSSAWNALDLNLTSYAGKLLRIKLRFDTIDSIANDYEGWYVDNVRVASDVGLGPGVPGRPIVTVVGGPDRGMLNVSWPLPAERGSPITHYSVYRSASGTGNFTHVGNTTERYYLDGGLGDTTRMFYRVSATNGYGEGPQSLAASGLTFTVPSTPTLSVARGPNPGELTPTWTIPSTGGMPITSYTLQAANASSGPFSVIATTPNTSFTETGLGTGVDRWYKVLATNEIGAGPLSAAVNGTTFRAPSAPTLGVVRGPGPGQLTPTWNAPSNGGTPITSYAVYASDSETSGYEAIGTTTGLSLIESGLGNGATRYYKVLATNAVGDGPLSLAASGITFTTPAAPTINVVPGPGAGQLRISWGAPNNGGTAITGYTVQSSTSPTDLFTTIGTTTQTTWTDGGLGNVATRYYKVLATNMIGDGPLSSAVGGTTFDVPGAPTSLSVTAGNRQLSLTWAASGNGGTPITSYRIYRANSSTGPFDLHANVSVGTFTDTGLPEGTRFWYRVSAVNIAGEGAPSLDANARTFARPAAPLNLVARPGGQLFTIDLTWQAPPDSGGTPVTQYRVYRDGVYVGSASVVTFRDRNLDPSQVYHYQVAAVNIVGEGAKGNDACARPYPWPNAPLVPQCEILGVGFTTIVPARDDETKMSS